MKDYTYKWRSYSLNVSCKKCGNNIPFGNFDGNPECDECDFVMNESWLDVLKFSEVQEISKQDQGSKTIMGKLNARIYFEKVNHISCPGCNKELRFEMDEQNESDCMHCQTKLPIKKYDLFNNLLFFGKYAHNNKVKSNKPIVLQCHTCAAPLRVVNNELQLHCESCGNDNLLSVPTQNSKLFSDIFIGEQVETFPPRRIQDNYHNVVRKTLLFNKREDFTDEELEEVMTRFPNNDAIFNAVHFTLNYRCKKETYELLWEKNKSIENIKHIGKFLEKSQEEIQLKIQSINQAFSNKPKTSGNNVKPSKTERDGEQPASKWVIAMVFIVVIVLVLVMRYFGYSGDEYGD